jgi:hypothetical protein
MGRVRKALLIAGLSLLSACGSGSASRVEKVGDELQKPRLVVPRAPDRHPFAPIDKVHKGEWATYREGERRFTLCAGEFEGEAMWIELIEEAEPRQVSARLVGIDGVVRKAWYGEIWKDGQRSSVEPQPLEQAVSAPADEPPASLAAVEATVVAAGREIRAARQRWSTEDLEGRRSESELVSSGEVPSILSWSRYGGLVLRKSAGRTLELQAFGTDGRLLLDRPR